VPFLPFPLDIPKAVIGIIQRCLSFEFDGYQRALRRQTQRPNISQVLDVVRSARQEMTDGTFDIFPSYNWGPQLAKDKVWKRQELVKQQVHEELKGADHMLWLDCAGNMGAWMEDCVREGVESSSRVVVFLSAEYCTSLNCRKELQFAHDVKTPIIVCMTEKDFWKDWKKEKWTHEPPKVDGVLPWTHTIVWDAVQPGSDSLLNDKGEGATATVRKLHLLNKMLCDFN
jgi:hypothetical protein